VAVVLAAGAYLNALHNPFVYDDLRLIVTNQSLRHLTDLHAIVLHEVTRPVVNLTYALDYAMWGGSPFGYHVTSLLLHLVNIALVYLLTWRLTDDRARRAPAAVDQPTPGVVAFVAALLFAVHPMMTEAVGYIAGRAEVLCATFFLLAVLAMRRWMMGGRAGWLVVSIASWLLALASKEIAVMFPFVILAYDRLVCPGSREDRRWRVTHLHVPVLVVGVIAVVARLVVFLAQAKNAGGVRFVWPYILAEIDVMRRYLLLLLMVEPGGQTVFHAVPVVGRVFTLSAIMAIGTLACLVWLVVVLHRARRSAASVGLVWFLLLLVPSAALVVFDRGEPMAEHRVYLASVGLFVALATGVGWLSVRFGAQRPVWRWAFRVTVVLGALSLTGHTVIRNAVWSTPVSLWADAVDKAPDHWYPALLLGESLHNAGRHDQAVAEFRRSIQLRPGEAGTYGKAGICLVELGRLRDAQAMFESMRKIDPWAPEGTNGLGTVALARNQLDLARQDFFETLQNNPLDVTARLGLVAVEERSGHPAEARTRCQEIQQLAPDTPESDDCLRLRRTRAAAPGSGGR
jgi:tetratricopeptide (TPR) repeat protein